MLDYHNNDSNGDSGSSGGGSGGDGSGDAGNNSSNSGGGNADNGRSNNGDGAGSSSGGGGGGGGSSNAGVSACINDERGDNSTADISERHLDLDEIADKHQSNPLRGHSLQPMSEPLLLPALSEAKYDVSSSVNNQEQQQMKKKDLTSFRASVGDRKQSNQSKQSKQSNQASGMARKKPSVSEAKSGHQKKGALSNISNSHPNNNNNDNHNSANSNHKTKQRCDSPPSKGIVKCNDDQVVTTALQNSIHQSPVHANGTGLFKKDVHDDVHDDDDDLNGGDRAELLSTLVAESKKLRQHNEENREVM